MGHDRAARHVGDGHCRSAREPSIAEGALGLNLVAHAPRKLAGEIAADYKTKEVDARRKAFIGKWRVKCEAVATSREGAGDPLYLRANA
jgi:hypothetical protein